MKRARIIISGDVVGVGFRAWVRRIALDNHLTGWVKNREDNAVEIVAEGTEQELKQLIRMCKHGPDVAWVKSISVSWLPATGEFLDFTVVY